MTSMPKVARRTEAQRVVGYLNAAREALRNARYSIGNDNPAYDRIETMLEQTYEVERVLSEDRGTQ